MSNVSPLEIMEAIIDKKTKQVHKLDQKIHILQQEISELHNIVQGLKASK